MDFSPVIARSPAPFGTGGARAVLDAAATALRHDDEAALALVLDTEGSTYVQAGALALFGAAGRQVGWLSGGCLEPDIALRAQQAVRAQRIEWLEIDTRSDEDLFAGSAVGCRGQLRLALLPLRALTAWATLIASWCDGIGPLRITLQANGGITARVGDRRVQSTLATAPLSWGGSATQWAVEVPRPPAVLVFGGGPESPILLPLLRTLGAMTTLVEQRPRWRAMAAHADRALELPPTRALASPQACDAALVMHHHFELDREALAALAGTTTGFIGLLGPVRRREDLFRVLPAGAREALLPRLHSPVGLRLGGTGPEAIALSIAAQLQAHLHGEAA
ncbi:XdhC family protein [Lysobacter cavernae]|uniref:XdhC family protein n=1 Tax=Lysobacter cavernae TaxID=1685901 RepID=A0ABV7RRL0_9GAMM